jgi:hypothetical protein
VHVFLALCDFQFVVFSHGHVVTRKTVLMKSDEI